MKTVKPFRTHHRRARILMVFMTLMALLFVQTLSLHMHHPQGSSHPHYEVHIDAFDVEDEEHGSATEIDLSIQVIAKNLKFSDTLIAVLTFMALLFVPFLINRPRYSIRLAAPFTPHGTVFRPPLRAPPL